MAPPPDAGEADTHEGAASRRFPGMLQIAWRHKLLLALGLVIGLVLGVLYYAQARPVYQSSALVLVIQKRPEMALPGTDQRSATADDFLATHQVLVRSPLIVGKAVDKAKLQNLASYADNPDPTNAIIESLKVTREKEAGTVLNLVYRTHVSADCAVVMDAIIDSYKDFLDATYRNVSEDTVKFIADARNVLEDRLEKTEKDFRKFRVANPDLLRGKAGISVLQERFLMMEAKRSVLRLRQAEIDGRIKSLQKAINDGVDRSQLVLMVSDSARRLSGASEKANLLDDPLAVLQLQEQSLAELYGNKHPQVMSIRKRIQVFQDYNKKIGREDTGTIQDPIAGHMQYLKQELDSARTEEKSLADLLKSERGMASKQIDVEVQEEAYRAEIARSQQLFESIVKRLTEINLLKDLGGFSAQTIAPASPGMKVAPRGTPIMAVAALLGLLSGLGMAYLAELADQSFRTPDEIRTRLGLPVVGHVPFFKPRSDAELIATADGKMLDAMLSAFYRPKSLESEAYRGIRTALYFSLRGDSHKVIQVTSPDMGDGKSTLTTNLAVSIAQTGKQVLLVDADFRRPRLHKFFGINAKVGLASVIAGDAELADAIRPTEVPNLAVLPCGPHPDNPAELLTQPKFKELLDLLREQYDYVLIDTPPILAVTDPCVVVPHVNGVLLTIRIGKNVRLHATRAKDILTTLGAKVLGVVVNEVNLNASSDYGYAGYRYGYGYTYTYYSGDKKSYAYRVQTPTEPAAAEVGAAHENAPGDEPLLTPRQQSSSPPGDSERKAGFWQWLLRK